MNTGLFFRNSDMKYFFRVSLKDTNIEKFDASCNHEHEEEVNHLKVSLIQERNDSSDVIGPKIFDVELFHHQNSSYLTVNYLKNKFEPASAKKILSTRKRDLTPRKWYHGEKWYQHQKGAKWYSRKKKPMKMEPKK